MYREVNFNEHIYLFKLQKFQSYNFDVIHQFFKKYQLK